MWGVLRYITQMRYFKVMAYMALVTGVLGIATVTLVLKYVSTTRIHKHTHTHTYVPAYGRYWDSHCHPVSSMSPTTPMYTHTLHIHTYVPAHKQLHTPTTNMPQKCHSHAHWHILTRTLGTTYTQHWHTLHTHTVDITPALILTHTTHTTHIPTLGHSSHARTVDIT